MIRVLMPQNLKMKWAIRYGLLAKSPIPVNTPTNIVVNKPSPSKARILQIVVITSDRSEV